MKIRIDYERIRKRCFICQRLTHDKLNCPYNSLGPSSSNLEKTLDHPIKPNKSKDKEPKDKVIKANQVHPPKLMAEAIKVYTRHQLPIGGKTS